MSATLSVIDPAKFKSLPLVTPDFGERVLIFHCAFRLVEPLLAGVALAGAGDVGAQPGHGILNGGDDGIAEGVSDLPLIVGGLNGFAGGKLNVECPIGGADDGDGELNHAGTEAQRSSEVQP